MLSKNDESKDAVLSYNRDVSGIIVTGLKSKSWEFFIDNYVSGSRKTAEHSFPSPGISAGPPLTSVGIKISL